MPSNSHAAWNPHGPSSKVSPSGGGSGRACHGDTWTHRNGPRRGRGRRLGWAGRRLRVRGWARGGSSVRSKSVPGTAAGEVHAGVLRFCFGDYQGERTCGREALPSGQRSVGGSGTRGSGWEAGAAGWRTPTIRAHRDLWPTAAACLPRRFRGQDVSAGLSPALFSLPSSPGVSVPGCRASCLV